MIRFHAPHGDVRAFDRQPVTLGRAPTSDVVLSGSGVSLVHALVVPLDGCWVVRDRGSTNGTTIVRGDGRLVVSTFEDLALANGDVLVLGEESLRIEIGEGKVEGGAGGFEPTVLRAEATGTRGEAARRAAAHRAQDLLILADDLAATKTLAEAAAALDAWARAAIPGCAGTGLLWGEGEGEMEIVVGSPSKALAERAIAEGKALLFSHPETVVAPLGDRGALQIDAGGDSTLRPDDLDLCAVAARFAAQALVRIELEDGLERARRALGRENRRLRERSAPSEVLRSKAPSFVRVVSEIERVAPTTTTVLFEGETGVGKEVLARFLHERSPRADALFVPVNCGAIAETLLESELFGHRKGAFTGASEDRHGLFAAAAGGTLFLDEIGETSPALQARLLRVLQEGAIRRVGDTTERRVDVRIVAATNRDLRALTEAGRFRQDLYYRLAVFPLRVPPLRERREDIPDLARQFVARFAAELARPVPSLPDDVAAVLAAYAWPGNVRQLMNEIERALIRMDRDASEIVVDLFSEEVVADLAPSDPPPAQSLAGELRELERRRILEALDATQGNQSRAARLLGMPRRTLVTKLGALGLSRSTKR